MEVSLDCQLTLSEWKTNFTAPKCWMLKWSRCLKSQSMSTTCLLVKKKREESVLHLHSQTIWLWSGPFRSLAQRLTAHLLAIRYHSTAAMRNSNPKGLKLCFHKYKYICKNWLHSQKKLPIAYGHGSYAFKSYVFSVPFFLATWTMCFLLQKL